MPQPKTVTEKQCGCCKAVKPRADFPQRAHKKNGMGRYCIPCQQAFDRQRRLERKQKAPVAAPRGPPVIIPFDWPVPEFRRRTPARTGGKTLCRVEIRPRYLNDNQETL